MTECIYLPKVEALRHELGQVGRGGGGGEEVLRGGAPLRVVRGQADLRHPAVNGVLALHRLHFVGKM